MYESNVFLVNRYLSHEYESIFFLHSFLQNKYFNQVSMLYLATYQGGLHSPNFEYNKDSIKTDNNIICFVM